MTVRVVAPGEHQITIRQGLLPTPGQRMPFGMSDSTGGAIAGLIEQMDHPTVQNQWQRILALWRSASLQHNPSTLPAPHVSKGDASDVSVEWVQRDRRFGFVIDPDEGESGWYFVSSPDSGGLSASGDLSVLDMSQLLAWATAPRPNSLSTS